MTTAPPALPVAGLIDDDPVDPGPKGRLAAEAGKGPENSEKDLLRQVQGFIRILEEVQRKGVNHALVGIDQVGAGGFVAGVTPFNKGGFRSVYVGPTDSASVLHQPSGNRRPHQSSTVLVSD